MHREEHTAFARERGHFAPSAQLKKSTFNGCVLEEVVCEGERFLSLHFPSVFEQISEADGATVRALAALLARERERLIGRASGARILFVGLGNPRAAVDALAPHAAEYIRPTAHLPASLCKKMGCSLLSVFCPSVSAQTGIESTALVKGATDACRAELVVVADAMTTRTPTRIGSTVQISERGILPGSGVGEKGTRLDRAFLGVPVLSLGFPIVLDATALSVGEGGAFDYLIPREGEAATHRLARILARAVERVFGIPSLF